MPAPQTEAMVAILADSSNMYAQVLFQIRGNSEVMLYDILSHLEIYSVATTV